MGESRKEDSPIMKVKNKKIPALALLIAIALVLVLLIFLLDEPQPEAEVTEPTEPVATTEATEPTDPYAFAHTPQDKLVVFARLNNLSIEEDWPEDILELLWNNPDAEEFALNYPLLKGTSQDADLSDLVGTGKVPKLYQWDERWGYSKYGDKAMGLTGCGPTCLSMVACYLTGDAAHSPDNMIRFALDNGYCSPGNGSSWTLFSQGAGKLGLTATELPLVKKTIFSHLEAGRQVICVMGPGVFTTAGHFIVMTGLKDGLICVNDPNSRANSQKLWDFDQISDQIRNLWMLEKAPVG